MELKDIGKLILFIVICQMAGIIGSFFTFDAIPGWYATLMKPDFSPPNWVFGPVWTTLYAMMGIAAYLIYRKREELAQPALMVFGGQLALNSLWSIIFFGLQSPGLALICIIALLLMVPYLMWVSFATILNHQIWVLNP